MTNKTKSPRRSLQTLKSTKQLVDDNRVAIAERLFEIYTDNRARFGKESFSGLCLDHKRNGLLYTMRFIRLSGSGLIVRLELDDVSVGCNIAVDTLDKAQFDALSAMLTAYCWENKRKSIDETLIHCRGAIIDELEEIYNLNFHGGKEFAKIGEKADADGLFLNGVSVDISFKRDTATSIEFIVGANWQGEKTRETGECRILDTDKDLKRREKFGNMIDNIITTFCVRKAGQ